LHLISLSLLFTPFILDICLCLPAMMQVKRAVSRLSQLLHILFLEIKSLFFPLLFLLLILSYLHLLFHSIFVLLLTTLRLVVINVVICHKHEVVRVFRRKVDLHIVVEIWFIERSHFLCLKPRIVKTSLL